MKGLLSFLIKGITGDKSVSVTESLEGDRTNLTIEAPDELFGIIIGKGGRTIKAIRNLVRVRATLEKKGVTILLPERKAS